MFANQRVCQIGENPDHSVLIWFGFLTFMGWVWFKFCTFFFCIITSNSFQNVGSSSVLGCFHAHLQCPLNVCADCAAARLQRCVMPSRACCLWAAVPACCPARRWFVLSPTPTLFSWSGDGPRHFLQWMTSTRNWCLATMTMSLVRLCLDTHTLRFNGHFSRWTWLSRLPP